MLSQRCTDCGMTQGKITDVQVV
eukprot:SAG11_NODE_5197_length_1633_cov_1.258149_4_plen_22_part_01